MLVLLLLACLGVDVGTSIDPWHSWHSNGRCGPQYLLTDGRPGQCDPNGNKNEVGPCCSNIGWCGNSDAHCKCHGCIDFRTNLGTPPLKAISAMLSTLWYGYPAERCIDGQTRGRHSMCHTNYGEKTPWLALDFGARVTVARVVINNRDDCCGDRLRNAEVRVADQLPSSGQVMSTGGQLLGTFKGPGKTGEPVSLTSSTPLQGRFVIVQTNHSPGTGYLNLNEVRVWSKNKGEQGDDSTPDWSKPLSEPIPVPKPWKGFGCCRATSPSRSCNHCPRITVRGLWRHPCCCRHPVVWRNQQKKAECCRIWSRVGLRRFC